MAWHRVTCRSCGKEASVPAKAIGRKATCVFCGEVMVVPTAQEEAAYRASLEKEREAEAEAERRRAEEERLRKEAAIEQKRRQKEEAKSKKKAAKALAQRKKQAEAEERRRRKEIERRGTERMQQSADVPTQAIMGDAAAPQTTGTVSFYCAQCGHALESEANFCTNCGKPITPNVVLYDVDVTVLGESQETEPPTSEATPELIENEPAEDALIRWFCPGPDGRGCGKRLRARKEMAGKPAVCPECHFEQTVPFVSSRRASSGPAEPPGGASATQS